jgi:hypothetical protein
MDPDNLERDLSERANQAGWRVNVIEPTTEMPFGAKRYYLALHKAQPTPSRTSRSSTVLTSSKRPSWA